MIGTARTNAPCLDLRGLSRIHWRYNIFSADGRDNSSRCYLGFERFEEETQTMNDIAIRIENLSKRQDTSNRIKQRGVFGLAGCSITVKELPSLIPYHSLGKN